MPSLELKRRYRRRGAAALELAVTAPILFGFLAFFWEYSRAEMIRQTIATAAYEGARQAIVEGAAASDAEQTAQAYVNAVSIQGSDIVVVPQNITPTTPSVQVSITVPLNENAYISPFFFKDHDITTSVTLQRFTSL